MADSSELPAARITFRDMIRIPYVFYQSIGEDLYEHESTSRVRNALYRFYFFVGFLNTNTVVLCELMHFGLSLRTAETARSAIAVAPCIGFSFLSDFKQVALAWHKKVMISHFDVMEALFPRTAALQRDYRVRRHYRIMLRIMYVFSVVCLAYTSTFSFYPFIRSTVRYYFFAVPHFERNLCFLTYYPFNTTANAYVFGTLYVTQMWAAHVAGMSFVAADLLLVASVTQLSMHFEYIVRCLHEYKWREGNEADNLRYLYELVQYHAKCLVQSENMNKVFGFSLLLNFLVASLTICFIGFQVTTSSTEDICKYLIFLVASLVQVFLVCYYGDALITSSLRVGDAAYHQLWYDASTRYKQMLIFIIARSQQPASIRPPTFPPISFETFMKVVSMSYQFFALLRTTYADTATE